MGILLKQLRISGFRGLDDTQIDFQETTVLVGTNNAGKTTILKALQLAFSNSISIGVDDFFYCEARIADKIIVDVLIIPVNEEGMQVDEFDDKWNAVFSADRITITPDGKQIVSFRTIVDEDFTKKSFRKKQYVIDDWPVFELDKIRWHQVNFEKDFSFHFDEIPFYYIDANRDILDDIKSKTSYFGKLVSTIEYSKGDKLIIEELIKELNKITIEKSDLLAGIETTLSELDTAMDSPVNSVSLSPFTKKLKDLNKGMNISYAEFSMDYHGMGTRSWSSLLVLKSFLKYFREQFERNEKVYYPILAIEEPEAHLHPNAQKRLYSQIDSIAGQKIVSTHSSYIAANAKLNQIRSVIRLNNDVRINKINLAHLSNEEIRKISRQVINTRGELFFSKILILCEGETEEQALPLFINKHFGKDVTELGIDIVGIGGGGNYYPFLHFAEALGIRWYILSDGEDAILKKLKKDLKKLRGDDNIDLATFNNIRYFESQQSFEDYLLSCGFQEEIEECLNLLFDGELEASIAKKSGTLMRRSKTNKICDSCKQNIFEDNFRDYSGDIGRIAALKDLLGDQKTKYSPILAELICKSNKAIPKTILELFEQLTKVLRPA